MNAAIRWPVIFLGLALASAPSLASTRVAIYAIVDDVTFEPSDFEPERVWITGVFVVPVPVSSGLHRPPARGHLLLVRCRRRGDGPHACDASTLSGA